VWQVLDQRGLQSRAKISVASLCTVVDEDDDERPVGDGDDDGAVGGDRVQHPLDLQTAADRPRKLYTTIHTGVSDGRS